MEKPCATCPFAFAIDSARKSIAIQLMDARAALVKMQRALALADDGYADLADATGSLGPERD